MASYHPVREQGDAAMGTAIIAWAFDRVRQFLCGLHGHDALLHFETGRLSMRCTSCGYQTPGWDLKSPPAGTEAVQTKARVLRLPLARERRVA
jgi:hypothetical protein